MRSVGVAAHDQYLGMLIQTELTNLLKKYINIFEVWTISLLVVSGRKSDKLNNTPKTVKTDIK